VKVTLDANVVLAARDRAEPHFDNSEATALVAADLAGRLFLRGADAVYAAVAKRSASSLISLDEELCRRAENEVPCFTPARWLRENPAS
jgi:predicted nucleic acid-binding protein